MKPRKLQLPKQRKLTKSDICLAYIISPPTLAKWIAEGFPLESPADVWACTANQRSRPGSMDCHTKTEYVRLVGARLWCLSHGLSIW